MRTEVRKLGAWNCPYCGKEKIWGNVFVCPGCQRPRSKDTKFYLPQDAPIVTSEIAQQLGSGGPNWYCEHCDSGNIDTAEKCWCCGAPKGSSPSHEIIEYQGEPPRSEQEASAMAKAIKKAEKRSAGYRVETSSPYQTAQGEKISRSKPTPKPQPSPPERTTRQKITQFFQTYRIELGVLAGIVLLILVGFFTYNFFFKTHLENATVKGFTWTQNVRVQEYRAVHETCWGSPPPSAYDIDEEYKDTGRDKKVHDGWKTVEYQDTCYRTVNYQGTCTRSVYESDTCYRATTRDNGDGSFTTSRESYECGSYKQESYSCTKTRQESYSCTKTRQEEIYHYEDIYDWYYAYTINRWRDIRNYPTSGGDHSPYFYQDFTLVNPYTSGSPELGQQRFFQERGKYVVVFQTGNEEIGKNGVFSRKYSLGDWERFREGSVYPIEVNYFDKIVTYPSP